MAKVASDSQVPGTREVIRPVSSVDIRDIIVKPDYEERQSAKGDNDRVGYYRPDDWRAFVEIRPV